MILLFRLCAISSLILADSQDDGRQVGQPEVDALRAWLRAIGKDGIKVVHDPADTSTEFEHQDAWIALEPEQIKSAIGNDGTFRPGCPLISGRGALEPGVAQDRPASSSKDGITLEVFHGTRAVFDEFTPSETGLFGPGIYLTSSQADAEQYAGEDVPVLRAQLKLMRPFYTRADYDAGEVHDIDSPAVPLVLELFGDDAGSVLRALRDDLNGGLGAIVQDRLMELGHDGIVIDWPDGMRHYVAFDSSQVRIKRPRPEAAPICRSAPELTS